MAPQGVTRYTHRKYEFEGSDSEYIHFLERRLSDVERRLLPVVSLAIQSPSCSPTISSNKREIRRHLTVIPYEHQPIQSPQTPHWVKEADKLLREVPCAKEWTKRWKSHGINSGEEKKRLIAILLGSPSVQPSTCPNTELGLSKEGKQATLLASITKYASAVKNFGIRTGLETCLAAFQELVFVSLCNVLLDHGFSEDDIDNVMRWHISNITSKSLKRLRSGAVWVNRLIDHLYWQGWGDRASEIFILWGKGIKQYGRFADSVKIYDYFVTRLSAPKYTTGFIGWSHPFSIPLLIKNLVGDSLTTAQISKALGCTTSASGITREISTKCQDATRSKKRRRLNHDNNPSLPLPAKPSTQRQWIEVTSTAYSSVTAAVTTSVDSPRGGKSGRSAGVARPAPNDSPIAGHGSRNLPHNSSHELGSGIETLESVGPTDSSSKTLVISHNNGPVGHSLGQSEVSRTTIEQNSTIETTQSLMLAVSQQDMDNMAAASPVVPQSIVQIARQFETQEHEHTQTSGNNFEESTSIITMPELSQGISAVDIDPMMRQRNPGDVVNTDSMTSQWNFGDAVGMDQITSQWNFRDAVDIDPMMSQSNFGDAVSIDPTMRQWNFGDAVDIDPMMSQSNFGDAVSIDPTMRQWNFGDAVDIDPTIHQSNSEDAVNIDPMMSQSNFGDAVSMVPMMRQWNFEDALILC